MQLPPAQPQFNQTNENEARFLTTLALNGLEARVEALEAAVGTVVTPPPTPPGPAFTYYKTGRRVEFADLSTATAPATVVAWAWDFGDGSVSAIQTPTHTYALDASYTVKLRVTDSLGAVSTQVQKIVTVKALGVPFGPHGPLSGPDTAVFTMSQNAEDATTILPRIAAARAAGKKLIFMLTGGAHSKYITGGVFDLEKWKHGSTAGAPAKTGMDQYNTQAIKDAVLLAVEEGVVLGCDIVDEPQAVDWGGTITKPVLDSMVDYVRLIFPTIPVGCSVRADYRTGDPPYQKLDFVTTQYIQNFGPPAGAVATWRDTAITSLALDKVKILFSFNGPNGGAGFNETNPDGTSHCPTARVLSPVNPCGGNGETYGGDVGRCAMSGPQMETFGLALMPATCLGLLMWKHNDAFAALGPNKTAFANLITAANGKTPTSWKRLP